MTEWRTSLFEIRSFSWSASWLSRTFPSAKLSPWYPQGRSTNYLRLDPYRKLGVLLLLALRTCWRWQDIYPSSNRRVSVQSFRIRSEFWGQLFLFKRKARARSRPFSVLNDRISTRFESTWTTSTYQSYYGIRSITSYKVDGCTASNTNCRCVQMFITPSTTFLSCYHRRIGWMPWQDDPTVDSPTPLWIDQSS